MFFSELKQEYPHKSQISKKIMFVDDQPIYYHRLGINKRIGKRGGLRVVYACRDGIIWGLFINAKGDKANFTAKDLKDIEEDFKNPELP